MRFFLLILVVVYISSCRAQESAVVSDREIVFEIDTAFIEINGADGHFGTNLIWSQGLYSNVCHWRDGQTYLAYQSTWQTVPFGIGRLLVYDEHLGLDRPTIITNHPRKSDTHNRPAFAFDDHGVLYVAVETVHNSPLKLYRWRDDHNFFETVEAIGKNLAYPNFLPKDASRNFYELSRGGGTEYAAYVVESREGMESWSSQQRITSIPSKDTILHTKNNRHYPSVPFNSFWKGTYKLVVSRRHQGELWYRDYVLTTTDFRKFSNEQNSYTHDVSKSLLTDEILNRYYTFSAEANNRRHVDSSQPVTARSKTTGKFFAVKFNPDTHAHDLIHFNDRWLRTPIQIKNLGEPPTDQTTPFLSLLPWADDNIWAIVLIRKNGLRKPFVYQTANLGKTWEPLYDLFPEFDGDIDGVIHPNNIMDLPQDRNAMIYFTAMDPATRHTRKLFAKRFAIGKIQREMRREIEAAKNLSDQYNVLRYVADARFVEFNGDAITNVEDTYRESHAKPLGKPVFDDASGSITVARSGLQVDMGAKPEIKEMTLIAVVRAAGDGVLFEVTSPGRSLIINAADRSTENKPSITITNSNRSLKIYGDDRLDDSNFHVLAVACDGERKCEIFVDGKKQFSHYELSPHGDTRASLLEGMATEVFSGEMTMTVGTSVDRAKKEGDVSFKELIIKNHIYDLATFHQYVKKVSDDHGITFKTHYR